MTDTAWDTKMLAMQRVASSINATYTQCRAIVNRANRSGFQDADLRELERNLDRAIPVKDEARMLGFTLAFMAKSGLPQLADYLNRVHMVSLMLLIDGAAAEIALHVQSSLEIWIDGSDSKFRVRRRPSSGRGGRRRGRRSNNGGNNPLGDVLAALETVTESPSTTGSTSPSAETASESAPSEITTAPSETSTASETTTESYLDIARGKKAPVKKSVIAAVAPATTTPMPVLAPNLGMLTPAVPAGVSWADVED